METYQKGSGLITKEEDWYILDEIKDNVFIIN